MTARSGEVLAPLAVQGCRDQVVAATKDYPFHPAERPAVLARFHAHDSGSRIVQAYVQTGKFLVDQGRLSSAPSAAQIAQHVDIRSSEALAGAAQLTDGR